MEKPALDLEAASPIPPSIRDLYEIHEWRHAATILRYAHPQEWNDILTVLGAFSMSRADIATPGGRKSPIPTRIDGHFTRLGWLEKAFDTKITVDKHDFDSPTHSVDCFKNRIALEIEWNNKDPFYDRDLNNFRLLFDLRTIDVGVIITRCDELQELFNQLNRGSSYGASTTHMAKLLPRIEGGGGGGCPILAFGIRKSLYRETK